MNTSSTIGTRRDGRMLLSAFTNQTLVTQSHIYQSITSGCQDGTFGSTVLAALYISTELLQISMPRRKHMCYRVASFRLDSLYEIDRPYIIEIYSLEY